VYFRMCVRCSGAIVTEAPVVVVVVVVAV
jgi:hypothetical protein